MVTERARNPATFECTPAVPKHDSAGGLAVAQKADGLTICEEQIRKVERDRVALRQCIERLTQSIDPVASHATVGPIANAALAGC
jgi:hypothetical protein